MNIKFEYFSTYPSIFVKYYINKLIRMIQALSNEATQYFRDKSNVHDHFTQLTNSKEKQRFYLLYLMCNFTNIESIVSFII